METAAEICAEIGATFWLESGLSEHRNADWFDGEPETLSHEQLASRFDSVRLEHDSLVTPVFPETHPEAEARVGETTRRIVDTETGTVLLVGHGLTIGGVVRGLVGSTDGVNAPLCGVTRLHRDEDDWHLDFSGDTTHLDAADDSADENGTGGA